MVIVNNFKNVYIKCKNKIASKVISYIYKIIIKNKNNFNDILETKNIIYNICDKKQNLKDIVTNYHYNCLCYFPELSCIKQGKIGINMYYNNSSQYDILETVIYVPIKYVFYI